MTVHGVVRKLSTIMGLGRSRPPDLAVRKELSIEEIKNQFYPDPTVPVDAFLLIWRDLGDTFGVSPGLIRPEDRFGFELPERPVLGMGDEDVVLGGTMKRRMKEMHISRPLPTQLRTVDDYVRFFFPS